MTKPDIFGHFVKKLYTLIDNLFCFNDFFEAVKMTS